MSLEASVIIAIQAETAIYERPAAAAIDALKIVQANHGWVSDQDIKEIADLLAMSPAELDGVATFYNLIYRRPVGRKVIHYCNSVTCWMLGAEDVRQAIGARLGIGLGETSSDGEYTLLPVCCLGACDKAPVVMVGDRTYFAVEPSSVDVMLKEPGG